MSEQEIFENLKTFLRSEDISFSEGKEILQEVGRPYLEYVHVIKNPYPKIYKTDVFTLSLVDKILHQQAKIKDLEADNEKLRKQFETDYAEIQGKLVSAELEADKLRRGFEKTLNSRLSTCITECPDCFEYTASGLECWNCGTIKQIEELEKE